MAFGKFIYRADSEYDDSPWERYQFPKIYLSHARKFERGWVVFLEPRRAKRPRGYFAAAKIAGIVSDTRHPGRFLATIEPGTYLDFGALVPFRVDGEVVEKGLLNEKGELSGRKQLAVRELSPEDFARIVSLGLGTGRADGQIDGIDGAVGENFQVRFPSTPAAAERTVRMLTDDDVRENNFQRTVLRAYGNRCAISGLRLINGGGHVEASASRIRPSDQGGPDATSNGIALSGTMRWMFERGLVGLDEDMTIMVSRQSNDPDSIRSTINETGRLIPPERFSEWPGTEFLMWHRKNRFMQ